MLDASSIDVRKTCQRQGKPFCWWWMMKRSIGSLLALLAPFVLTYCNDSEANVLVPISNGTVAILDECDPTTFNAALGAGACTRQGTVTFAAFNAELAATKSVSTWRFNPSSMTMTIGGTITATNQGGETHTFTQVAQFGGGTVAALNQASGNLIETPECAAITNADLIAPGGSFTTGQLATAGTHLYQCCIHPWMHETVTVTGP
jgi:plastocyanin